MAMKFPYLESFNKISKRIHGLLIANPMDNDYGLTPMGAIR